MIVATGSVEYLTDQINLLESIKKTKVYGDFTWEMGSWTNEDEEKLNLLKELLKYKKLYYKVEKELESR